MSIQIQRTFNVQQVIHHGLIGPLMDDGGHNIKTPVEYRRQILNEASAGWTTKAQQLQNFPVHDDEVTCVIGGQLAASLEGLQLLIHLQRMALEDIDFTQ